MARPLPSSTIVTRRRRAVLTWTLTLVLGLLALSMLVVVLLRWVNPPTSAVMLQHGIAAHFQPSVKPPDVHHRWVDWDRIPPSAALAVIAAEDQRFPSHHGFDLVELRHA